MEKEKRESIFFASVRAFFTGLCKWFGIGAGIILAVFLLGSLSTIDLGEPESKYSPEIVADAEGERLPFSKTKPTVLQINVKGLIGADKLTHHSILQMLVESREDDLEDTPIRAILLHINTPGGTVIDSDGIYRALKEYKRRFQVPVYAYVDGLCASGGMYVAAAADKVYASDTSLIGSVGVVLPGFINIYEALEKIGVQTKTISAGKWKDMMNPLRPWKEGEDDNLVHITDYYYRQFVNLVAENRPNLNKEKLIDVYGAKIFPAREAAEFGFIDFSGKNRNDALKDLLRDAGLEGKDYQVVELEKFHWISELLNQRSPLFTGRVEHRLSLDGSLPPEFHHQYLYLYRPL